MTSNHNGNTMDLHSLLDLTPLALSMCSFLSGKDTLRLQCVSRTCHRFVLEQQEALFQSHLVHDFCEGQRVAEAFTRSHKSIPSYKKVYWAFFNRWRLQKEHKEKYLGISWRRPVCTAAQARENARERGYLTAEEEQEGDEGEPQEPQEQEEINQQEGKDGDTGCAFFPTSHDTNVNALVFIVRVGDCPKSCGFLDWKMSSQMYNGRADCLFQNPDWNKSMGPLDLPPIENDLCRMIDSVRDAERDYLYSDYDDEQRPFKKQRMEDLTHDAKRRLGFFYRLSLHVVDVEACQVLTLLDESPASVGHGMDRLLSLYWGGAGVLPTFFCLPLRGSPFYEKFSSADYHDIRYEREYSWDQYREVAQWRLTSSLGILRSDFHPADTNRHQGYDDDIYVEHKHLNLDFHTDESPDPYRHQDRYTICSYLRALMKEKCLGLPNANENVQQARLLSPQQPFWLKEQRILDRVLSYAPFEEQASSLRLVCQAFKAAAMRQLENKCFDQEWFSIASDNDGAWFRVQAKRGWSEDYFTCPDNVIDEALGMLSCRCFPPCAGKKKCPGTQDVPTFCFNGVVKTIDMEQARRELSERGNFQLTSILGDDHHAKYRYRSLAAIYFESEHGKSLYGVCGDVYQTVTEVLGYGRMEDMRQLMRSLFLVFTDGASLVEGHFPEITVARAKVDFSDEGGNNRAEMKKIYRFRTAANEPVEIVLEGEPCFGRLNS